MAERSSGAVRERPAAPGIHLPPSPIYGKRTPVDLSPTSRPLLFVVVDTEEEFDWDAPFSRQHTSVRHLRSIQRLQAVFDRYGVRPTYVVDYPVATQPDGFEPLRAIAADGRCLIGAHMHPWVTPPETEAVNGRNSFTCNLEPSLQADKLDRLIDAIARHFGERPRIFKAGRYGIGHHLVELLASRGFEVDQSVMPHYDFSADGGPSFRDHSARPFLFGATRMLALPCTAIYLGLAGRAAERIYDLAAASPLRHLRLAAVVTRLHVADRLVLSPEGFSLAEMRRVADSALARGLRTLTLTLHSPSVEPGHTPYVRTAGERDAFLDRIDAFLDHFFGRHGGGTMTPLDFRSSALDTTPS